MSAEKKRVPKRRFKEFLNAGDWEQRRLGEVVKGVKRNDPDSTAPIMMITANKGFINQSERYSYENSGKSLKKYILLEKDELAYNHGASKARPFGSCFALREDFARVPFVYHCFQSEVVDPEFLALELNGKRVERLLKRLITSGARMDGLLNISFDEYSTVIVALPSRTEQEALSIFFQKLDNLITLHQRKLEKLQNLKKAYLNEMFI